MSLENVLERRNATDISFDIKIKGIKPLKLKSWVCDCGNNCNIDCNPWVCDCKCNCNSDD